MADKKQLARLTKSVKAWNERRAKNPDEVIDLIGANLIGTSLSGANLSGANLIGADFSEANLSRANLSGVNLTGADLIGANLIGADLIGANLSGANLSGANLSGTNLSRANLSESLFGNTTLEDVDLSTAKGLETVKHVFPSSIGINTIYESKGNIPEVFLRGAGVPENFIAFMHSLTGKAFEFYSCFISHSAIDKPFCERLYADLQARGVRTWYFPEDAKWGETVWGEIDRGIKIYDKLVVVLSENSLQSKPVLREIERSLKREDREHKNILFPIRLDDYVFSQWEHARKADVLEKVVGDFSGWDTSGASKYQQALDKLLKGLQAGDGKAP